MQILVFDTSLNKTYITLALQDSNTKQTTFVSKKIESTERKYHSAFLISQIKKTLEENIIDLKNIDAIGVNIGPGSFTGIRVCLTVAKTIAQQTNTRLIGTSSCEILSKIHADKNKIYPVLMDARRGMYYCYNPSELKKIQLLKPEELKEVLENNEDKTIVTDNNSQEIAKKIGLNPINYEENNFSLGDILAEITLAKINSAAGIEQCHWSIVKPLYIQTPPVLG